MVTNTLFLIVLKRRWRRFPPTKEKRTEGEGDQEAKLEVSNLLNNYVTFRVFGGKGKITNDCMVLLIIEPLKRPGQRRQ